MANRSIEPDYVLKWIPKIIPKSTWLGCGNIVNYPNTIYNENFALLELCFAWIPLSYCLTPTKPVLYKCFNKESVMPAATPSIAHCVVPGPGLEVWSRSNNIYWLRCFYSILNHVFLKETFPRLTNFLQYCCNVSYGHFVVGKNCLVWSVTTFCMGFILN